MVGLCLGRGRIAVDDGRRAHALSTIVSLVFVVVVHPSSADDAAAGGRHFIDADVLLVHWAIGSVISRSMPAFASAKS